MVPTHMGHMLVLLHDQLLLKHAGVELNSDLGPLGLEQVQAVIRLWCACCPLSRPPTVYGSTCTCCRSWPPYDCLQSSCRSVLLVCTHSLACT